MTDAELLFWIAIMFMGMIAFNIFIVWVTDTKK